MAVSDTCMIMVYEFRAREDIVYYAESEFMSVQNPYETYVLVALAKFCTAPNRTVGL